MLESWQGVATTTTKKCGDDGITQQKEKMSVQEDINRQAAFNYATIH